MHRHKDQVLDPSTYIKKLCMAMCIGLQPEHSRERQKLTGDLLSPGVVGGSAQKQSEEG